MLKQLQLTLLGIGAAAYLRPFFPGLSWVTWQELTHQPSRRWVGAVLGLPLVELFRHGLGHIFAAVLYLLVARTILPASTRRLPYLLVGFLPSALWMVASGARHQPKPHQLPLLLVYGLTGLLYGFLYHRYFVKNRVARLPAAPLE